MLKQKIIFESGNELASFACKQINYHIMGYYPITPSTQIAENLDLMYAEGISNTKLIATEGEHSAAGLCYGASVSGGRVFSATSANGLLYSLEQLPVQSGTRFPMVLNVACRCVSGPLSIKGDHSDIMYTLNTGWLILFAKDNQEVYDFNIIGLKLAEKVNLPIIVAFDGFFTSHQKRKAHIFENDEDVQNFIGKCERKYSVLDIENPITIGSYMNEPDLINNKFQLHRAMEEARNYLPKLFEEYADISGRKYSSVETYLTQDADVLLFLIGSSFETAKDAIDKLRKDGKKVGAFTTKVLRPWILEDIQNACKNSKIIICLDRQDSYGSGGGNMSIELKASLQELNLNTKVITRIYGLSGKDFYVKDAISILNEGLDALDGKEIKRFDYFGIYKGNTTENTQFFKPISKEDTFNITDCKYNEKTNKFEVTGGLPKDITVMPKRIAPGHGACPGCSIPVNINLLLSGIEGYVVLLFQTGCGMVVTTSYPKTSFKVSYVHNLFQNGAATISGIVEMFKEKKKRGEIDKNEDITFIMVSGDGGLDIGLGSAIGSCIRNHNMIIFEYDNGGYMNTGYQLSYSTPKGAKTSTSHIGKNQWGKNFFQKDNPQIFAATNIPYVATVSESNITDFVRKARKAQEYSKKFGLSYIKCLSACPLNWGDNPKDERKIIDMAVKCCYHPLYEIEQGITNITYNPEEKDEKIPISDWLFKMGRTKHLKDEKYKEIIEDIQKEVDKRWEKLKIKSENPYL